MHRRFLLLAPLVAFACAQPAPVRPAVVFFNASSAALEDGAPEVIRQSAERARATAGPVRVLGFAAPQTGAGAYNAGLAQARAQAVRDALERAGVPASRLSIGNRGPVPFEQFPTEARRVEITVGD